MSSDEGYVETRTPMVRLWLAFFAWTAAVALMVQLVLLPYLFPAWNAGDGLLAGTDSPSAQEVAVQVAAKIRTQGWSAWELRPQGQASSGIAAAVYALTVPRPWVLIPISAALHATAVVALLLLVQLLLPDWRRALWAVLPFLLYPSAMTWYAQLLKDGYSVAGALICVYGWALLSSKATARGGPGRPFGAALCVVLGGVLAWIVRPYNVEMILAVGTPISLLLTAVVVSRSTRAGFPWRRAAILLLLTWMSVAAMIPLVRGTTWASAPEASGRETAASSQTAMAAATATATAPAKIPGGWDDAPWLPHYLESGLYTIAVVRDSYRYLYPAAGSNVDTDVRFHSVYDEIAYLPRAAQIGFLAPFPDQWFEHGSLPATTVMRRISALEMVGVYLALALLPYSLWRWRRRAEMWILVLFSVGMLLILAMSIPNVGALYRLRYPFLMALVALGIAGYAALGRQAHLKARPGWLFPI